MSNITVGNAIFDADKGWFIGSFFDEKLGLRHTQDLEVKWGIHKKGEQRSEWVTGEKRKTLGILISGKWKMIFKDEEVILSEQGDFVMWDKGVDHMWEAIEDTTIITVRWPSIKMY